MLYHLLKLRQACNHPWLVKGYAGKRTAGQGECVGRVWKVWGKARCTLRATTRVGLKGGGSCYEAATKAELTSPSP